MWERSGGEILEKLQRNKNTDCLRIERHQNYSEKVMVLSYVKSDKERKTQRMVHAETGRGIVMVSKL